MYQHNRYTQRDDSLSPAAIVIWLCFCIFIYFCLISVGIAELDIGVKNLSKDHLCSTDLVPFGLATWLTYGGLIDIIFITIYLPTGIFGRLWGKENDRVKNLYRIIAGPLILIYSIFLFCWVITGIVIFDHVDSNCKSKSKSVWSMTIVSFFWRIINVISLVCESSCLISKISFPKRRKRIYRDSTDKSNDELDNEEKSMSSQQKSGSSTSSSSSSSSSPNANQNYTNTPKDEDTSSKNLATTSSSTSSISTSTSSLSTSTSSIGSSTSTTSSSF